MRLLKSEPLLVEIILSVGRQKNIIFSKVAANLLKRKDNSKSRKRIFTTVRDLRPIGFWDFNFFQNFNFFRSILDL